MRSSWANNEGLSSAVELSVVVDDEEGIKAVIKSRARKSQFIEFSSDRQKVVRFLGRAET